MARRESRALPPGPLARLPPRIALVDLDDELAGFLIQALARHWPAARVFTLGGDERMVADLLIVDLEPRSAPRRPTLWLADLDRSQSMFRVGPLLWRSALPTTPARLKRLVEACLDGVGA
jgi:hypothetical protein